jgi:hypothetical protein
MIVLQAQRDRLIREEQMLQEERLAAELEKRKLDGIRDEKMRQQIRETRCVYKTKTNIVKICRLWNGMIEGTVEHK